MKVRHPHHESVVKDVQDVEAWLKAGWLKVEEEARHVVRLERDPVEDDDES